MRPPVLSLLLASGPALAQDAPHYDAGGFAKCLAAAPADAGAAPGLRTCIGQASTPCMAMPGGDTIFGRVECLGHESLRYQGGTLGGPAAQNCLLRLTAEQALRLRDIAEARV